MSLFKGDLLIAGSLPTPTGAMSYKGSVLQSNLPTSGQQKGDYYKLLDVSPSIYTGQCAIWNGSSWDYSSSNINVDEALSTTSTNPVQNKTITTALNSLNYISKTATIEKVWSGTKAQYDAITTKDAKTLYNITDDNTVVDQFPVGSIFEAVENSVTHPATGTWEALPDRLEFDGWKNVPLTSPQTWSIGTPPTLKVKDGLGLFCLVALPTAAINDGDIVANGIIKPEISQIGFTGYTNAGTLIRINPVDNIVKVNTSVPSGLWVQTQFVYAIDVNDSTYKSLADRVIKRWKRTA